jgi:hypothetical protein
MTPTKKEYVNTTWELRTYDVWGNSRDGFEVNDTYRIGQIELRIPVEHNNVGTAQAFDSAYPSDSQIRKAFGLRRFKLELDGDDLSIYINRAKDGYPLGEMYCTSHESLSPIRVGGAKRIRCDQCEACMINGVFCHETGCPNTHSRFDAESGEWVRQRKCFECGCTIDADDPCCNAEVSDRTATPQ